MVKRLKIEKVVYRGKGLARHEGKVVFIPGVLEGEVVEAEIVLEKKKYAEARLVKVVEPSRKRVEPACPLVMEAPGDEGEPTGHCPGCAYQHMEYDEEIRVKQAQLENFLERSIGVDGVDLLSPVKSPQPLGYRNKIVLHGINDGKRTGLGYYGEDNETIIDVEQCLLAADEINRELALFRKQSSAMAGYEHEEPVTLRYTKKEGVLSWIGRAPWKDKLLTEKTSIGDIAVPVGGFFQINRLTSDLLFGYVADILEGIKPSFLIDLYCGVGVFGITAARKNITNIVGIDNSFELIEAARLNASELGIDNIAFYETSAREGLEMHLGSHDITETALVVDPPRKGLGQEIIEAIKESPPANIIYISCAVDILTRDLKKLKETGYKAVSARLIDMFPRTAIFETVVVLEYTG